MENETTTEVVVAEPAERTWFDELMERLMMVLVKLLLKFGIKIAF